MFPCQKDACRKQQLSGTATLQHSQHCSALIEQGLVCHPALNKCHQGKEDEAPDLIPTISGPSSPYRLILSCLSPTLCPPQSPSTCTHAHPCLLPTCPYPVLPCPSLLPLDTALPSLWPERDSKNGRVNDKIVRSNVSGSTLSLQKLLSSQNPGHGQLEM